MALNMRIEATNIIEVNEDLEKDLTEAYEKLATLPKTRMVTIDFTDAATEEDNIKAASRFVRVAKQWAESQEPPLAFRRIGKAADNKTRVSFRIYLPKQGEEDTAETAE